MLRNFLQRSKQRVSLALLLSLFLVGVHQRSKKRKVSDQGSINLDINKS